jgi:FAD/FMN-containing dehydrogenase
VVATGHGAVVSADGAVLINTRQMTDVRIDPVARTASIEAGAQWQHVVEAAARHGLAPAAGSSPSVGAVAYTLGGGLSPALGRAFGFAADHVRSLDIATADGRLRHVTAENDAELFWGLRGGKGNFGVVTALEFELFPITRFYGGGLYFDGTRTSEIMDAFRELVTHAAEELTVSLAFLRLPPAPFVPEPLQGRFAVHLRVAYLGEPEAGAKLLAGVRAIAEPLIDDVRERPFTDFAAIHNDPVDPLPVNDRGILLRELPAAATDVILELAGPAADFPVTMVEIRHFGGALSRPPAVPNAISARDAQFSVFTAAVTAPELRAQVADLQQSLLTALAPWSDGRRYLNFLGEQDATVALVETAFEAGTYRRLAELKREVDPANTFRINHNIPPAA